MRNVRPPAVAGQFYDSAKERLEQSLQECFLHEFGPGAVPEPNLEGPGRIAAVVSPHAGYVFSGPAAANGFAALARDGVPDAVIIVGPSHWASARRAALSSAEAWSTPLGEAALATDLRDELLRAAREVVEVDDQAHAREHSLEVQVPFLQFLYRERMPKLLPICLRLHAFEGWEAASRLAEALGRALVTVVGDRRAVVVASTDFSHQIPHQAAERQDRLALAQIEQMQPAGLLQTVVEHRVTTCGPVAVATALWFCLGRGARSVELLRYYTSGDIIGERTAVVGYASLVIRGERGGAP